MSLTVVWSAQARNQFVASLAYIAKDDPLSAEKVHQRMAKSIALLCNSPQSGVAAPSVGVRTYAVPKTGHSFDYRLVRDQIRILRWFRQRQKPVSAGVDG